VKRTLAPSHRSRPTRLFDRAGRSTGAISVRQGPHPGQRGVTIVELMVALTIIAILLSLLIPATRLIRQSAAKTRELSAARQLMVGYLAYATDNRGAVMPGYYFAGGHTLPAEDERGTDIADLAVPVAAARYPWRLAPYLNYDFKGLYLDERALSAIQNDATYHYAISLYPSFGINGVFVGGDSDDGFAFSPLYENLFGRFYVRSISQPKRPTDLIVFCSARSDDEFAPANLSLIEGHYKVLPPYLTERKWMRNYEPDSNAASDFGFVSLRDFRAAMIGYFDGHTGQLEEGQLQDMRHWADQADRPDWTLIPKY